jgi:hypothetical protein
MVDATAPPSAPAASVPPRRLLLVDERGGMRVSWHDEDDLIVLSLWRGETCIGTFRLPPEDARRLATFIEQHLAGRAAQR